MDTDLFARRIENLYIATTGAKSPHGARSWFARQARVAPRTVSRWLHGERTPDGPVLALLDLMERMAGIG